MNRIRRNGSWKGNVLFNYDDLRHSSSVVFCHVNQGLVVRLRHGAMDWKVVLQGFLIPIQRLQQRNASLDNVVRSCLGNSLPRASRSLSNPQQERPYTCQRPAGGGEGCVAEHI
jgi:hypothetical protein